jgi:AhpC/TSA antioxidant enzyme
VKLAETEHRLKESNTTVIVASFESMARIAGLQARLQLPFEYVADPQRHAYRAFGLGRASFLRTYAHHEVVAFYARELLRGHVPDLHRRQDRRQLGGDFVIDRKGFVILAHPERGPEDRVDVADLVRTAERAADR